jgi:hypothetical protein
MLNIYTIGSELFRTDEALRREMLDLLASSYQDPSALLARELEHCNSLYLARDGDRLLCFFFVAWETVEVDGYGSASTIYLGLSATRQEVANTGFIGSVYFRCEKDIVCWERKNKRRLLLWGTTANPTIYLVMCAFRACVEPALDGSYSSLGAKLARAFRSKLAAPLSNDEHPFVLKGLAGGTRYSREEVERIERVSETKKFSLLCALGINEAAGDRMLFIARRTDEIDFDYSIAD